MQQRIFTKRREISVENYRKSFVNADKHGWKGLWTREQGKEKSVSNYVMTNIKYLISIKEMIIDETKEHAFYRLEEQNQDIKKVY